MKYFFILILSCFCFNLMAIENKTLVINSDAPEFELKGVDGKTYNLQSFNKSKILVIIFTCNHCPTSQAYEDRIIKLANTYSTSDVQIVAISPNNNKSIRLDEQGYTELGDSFEEMKQRAADKNFNFPYLYDGDDQSVTEKYGPNATPHAFVFDQKRTLKYSGRIDDNECIEQVTATDLKEAIEALLQGKDPEIQTTKTFGCAIKWTENNNFVENEIEEWSKEPVLLNELNLQNAKDFIRENKSGKYRLINFWATWCSPCVSEFQELTNIYKMYRNRGFDFFSVSLDAIKQKEKVLNFLKEKKASNPNFQFVGNQYDLIEAIDPNWQGALPYTIVLSPENEIVFSKEGIISAKEIRNVIINKIGRY